MIYKCNINDEAYYIDIFFSIQLAIQYAYKHVHEYNY